MCYSVQVMHLLSKQGMGLEEMASFLNHSNISLEPLLVAFVSPIYNVLYLACVCKSLQIYLKITSYTQSFIDSYPLI